MDKVSSILPKVLKKRGLHKHASASLVVNLAQEWLEKELPKIRDDISVSTIKDSVLTISTKNSVAAQECRHVCDSLLTYLKGQNTGALIEDIRIVREYTVLPK